MEMSLTEKQHVAKVIIQKTIRRELTRVICCTHNLTTSVQFINTINVTANDNI